jgi:hypothetical protein
MMKAIIFMFVFVGCAFGLNVLAGIDYQDPRGDIATYACNSYDEAVHLAEQMVSGNTILVYGSDKNTCWLKNRDFSGNQVGNVARTTFTP